MVALAGSGSFLGIAGCLGDDDTAPADVIEDPDDIDLEIDYDEDDDDEVDVDIDDVDELPHVEGQTFRLRTGQNPAEYTFFYPATWMETEYDAAYINVRQATEAEEFYGRWFAEAYHEAPGEVWHGLYEDHEWIAGDDEDRIWIKIREDANWSDGEPVRAYDAKASGANRMTSGREGRKWHISPEVANPWMSATNIEMPNGPDGKEFELVDETGELLEVFWEDGQMYDWALAGRTGSIHGPTHVEPYDEWAERAIRTMDLAREQPDEPWDDIDGLEDRFEQTEAVTTEEHLEMWRDPDHIVTNGAWQVAEILETEFRLEPNPHFYNADRVNFDEVVYSWVEEDHRARAEVRYGAADHTQVVASPELVAELPDHIEEVTVPSPGGVGIGYNFDHFAFGDRRVRWAIAYALDTSGIANAVHPTATRPVNRPGGEVWAIDAWLDQAWIEENLVDYSQDLDRATQLMQEAGFERIDGVWHKDGEPFEVMFPTSDSNPVMELVVEDQLNEFGIDVTVQSFDAADYQERLDSGAFDMWPESGHTSFAALVDSVPGFWWRGINHEDHVRRRNLFSEEDQERTIDGYTDAGWVAGDYTLWEHLMVEIPEPGQPDADPTIEWSPAYIWGDIWRGPREMDVETFQKFAWTANWWMPVLPLFNELDQHFINTENFLWPRDQPLWEYFGFAINENQLLGLGYIQANPEAPKEEAQVVIEE